MDHAYIQEHGLVELYHQGALRPEEEERFEAHFVDCPRCIEDLEAARGLQAGIRQVAAEDAARGVARAAVAAQVGVLAGIAQLLRRPGAAMLFAGGLAAITLSALWLGNQVSRRRSDVQLARAEAGSWQERFEGERDHVTELERRLAEIEASGNAGAGELDGLRARLDEAITARDESAGELERLKRPKWNTQVFILSVVRGGGEPASVIDLREAGEWLSLAVDVDIDPRITSYRVKISGWPDKRLWRRDDLQPNAFETLMITFPASYFRAGDYQLTVGGLLAAGGSVEVDRFDFRVIDED